MKIPFNKPWMVGKELTNIARSVLLYNNTSGDGYYTKYCQSWLENNLDCPKALLTHSCTGALEMASILCNIEPGDEVILPSFTFVSTANAFVLRGATPVFVDILEENFNINPQLVEDATTNKTKAVVPVHYAGTPCDMDVLHAIASKYGLKIIEDAAQGMLSKHKNKYLGTIGHLGALSFHETKNIISGEGGALLVNDPELAERAEIIWQKGTNRKQFERNHVDFYTWVDVGSSFLPSDIIAAFLAAQLEEVEYITSKRIKLCHNYCSMLHPLVERGHILLPQCDTANGHLYYILANTPEERDKLLAFMNKNNVSGVFHYIPLHSSPGGMRYGRAHGNLSVTNDISKRLIRLPIYCEMSTEEQAYVVETIFSFYS